MKTIVNKSQVAHLFAHQAQDYASTSTRNFYFQGNMCYSYGRHYVAAVHHDDIVLLNSNTYSVTTTGHLSELRSACRHLETISVPTPGATTHEAHKENFEYLVTQYEREVLRLSRARVYTYPEQARGIAQDANAYAIRFKLRQRLKEIPLDEAKPAILAREQAKQRAIQAKQRKHLTEWRNGAYHGSLADLPVACRLTTDKLTLQTTLGAEVPVDHVRRWLPAVIEIFNEKRVWARNGSEMRLGQFHVDKVDGQKGVLIAGCHTITRKEIQHIAALIA